jgi:hypothetical protein
VDAETGGCARASPSGSAVDALQAHADELVEERPHEVLLAAEVAVDRRRVGAELAPSSRTEIDECRRCARA